MPLLAMLLVATGFTIQAWEGVASPALSDTQTGRSPADAGAGAGKPTEPTSPITIVSASFGFKGVRPGTGDARMDDTRALKASCDGRAGCDHRVDKAFGACRVASQIGRTKFTECANNYVVEWLCGGSQTKHRLLAEPQSNSDFRVRLNCGDRDRESADLPVSRQTPGPPKPAAVGANARAGEVRGLVVADSGRGLAGRKVFIGQQSTITDGDGRFSLAQVPSKYDVMVAEPGRDTITVYYGLTRRDPILSHAGAYTTMLDEPNRHASISGLLSGGDIHMPVVDGERVTLYYISPKTQSVSRVSPNIQQRGPDYRMLVSWRNYPSIDGTLIAIAEAATKQRRWTSAWLATRSLALADGDAVNQDLRPRAIPMGRIAGRVEMSQGHAAAEVHFGYQLPNGGGAIEIGRWRTNRGAFDCEMPDLSALAGSYCVDIEDVFGHAQVTRCGAQVGMTDFRIAVQPPPAIVEPGPMASIGKEALVSWTGEKDGVYLLEVGPTFGAMARVEAYVAGTQLAWPNLEAMGKKFPVGVNAYCQVSRMVPYASMDDLASARGPFARRGMDFQQISSEALSVTLVGPVEEPVSPAPSNVRDLPNFPDGIPVCASIEKARSFAELDDHLAGQQVTVRGMLTFGPDWWCTKVGCGADRGPCCINNCDTQWRLVDRAVPSREVRIARSMRANECKRPQPPLIDVVATGILLIDEGISSATAGDNMVDSFILDQANLCRVSLARTQTR